MQLVQHRDLDRDGVQRFQLVAKTGVAWRLANYLSLRPAVAIPRAFIRRLDG
jgi:hypothetical protein